ncbi:Uncharacterised protein [uncultured Comamonas sp.]|nr:Uncharacterised protein [uncultured Comamonas sp.]
MFCILVVVIQLASQKVSGLSGLDRGSNGQRARCRFHRQLDLVEIFMRLGHMLFSCNFKFDLGIDYRHVVGGAIQVKRDVSAVEYADKFKGIGSGGKSRQRRPGGDRRCLAMTMTVIGVR